MFLRDFPRDSQSTYLTCTIPVMVPHFGISGPIVFYLHMRYLYFYVDIVVDVKAAVRKVLETFK